MKKRLLTIGLVAVVAGAMLFGVASAQGSGPTVIIATGENFPDALGAASTGNPLLLVAKDFVPSATASQLTDMDPSQIYVVGGTGVVSTTVENALKAWAPVTRLSGADRYATAAAVADAGIAVAGVPGPAGPAGPEGPQGPAGSGGVSGVYVNRLALQKLSANSQMTDALGCESMGSDIDCETEVLCDGGDLALAADFIFSDTNGNGRSDTQLFYSQRNSAGDGWVYDVKNGVPSELIDVTLGVVCLEL